MALHMMYDEWGNPQLDTDFNINKSGVSNLNNYTGYTYDDVLGIYYAQARFYDAGIKRFIQEDPIKDGMNWYAYVGNNPINAIDPCGLFSSGDILSYEYGVYKEDNVLLQRKLSEMGLYHGDIDGMFGVQTREAVRKYQNTIYQHASARFTPGVVNTFVWERLGLETETSLAANSNSLILKNQQGTFMTSPQVTATPVLQYTSSWITEIDPLLDRMNYYGEYSCDDTTILELNTAIKMATEKYVIENYGFVKITAGSETTLITERSGNASDHLGFVGTYVQPVGGFPSFEFDAQV